MNRMHRIGHAGLVAGYIAARVVGASAEPTPSAAQTPPEPAQPAEPTQPAEAPRAVAPTAPPEGYSSSLEISGAFGPSVVFGEPANPEYTQSFGRVGMFGEFGVAYRSSYFIDPFISVSYATLANGVSTLPPGPWGAGGTLDQHLGTWVIAPGITSDIWRIRLRYGLGLAVVVQKFGYAGHENSSTQLPLAHQFGLGMNLLDKDWFRLDAEARLIAVPGADVTYTTFTVVARGDLVRFGKR